MNDYLAGGHLKNANERGKAKKNTSGCKIKAEEEEKKRGEGKQTAWESPWSGFIRASVGRYRSACERRGQATKNLACECQS